MNRSASLTFLKPFAIIACVLAPLGFLISLGGLALTANSCGMFADGCDTYGQPAAGFGWFVALFAASPLALVAGIVVLVVSRTR